ncbi:MAG: nuclear transport factor 2 family protein [Solirubrobacterales bacterium]
MSESDVELVRRIYGFDWVGVGSRREGFAELGKLVAPDFHSRLSPELGERVVEGVKGLEEFTQALEHDFSEFRYDPEEFIAAGKGIVVAIGRIHAQGRYSRMPLSGEFGHVWTLRDGRAATVTAYRDWESAKREAGLA